MTQRLRVAQRLRLAREHLAWMSIHAPRVPLLAGAIAKAAEDLNHIEAVLRIGKRTRPNGAVADRILKPMEQRLQELLASVETQLRTREPAPCRAHENELVVASDSPLVESFHERIALINSNVVRLRTIATHPSARDAIGRAAAALLDSRRWLDGDLNREVFERVESALEWAAWRVRAVQETVDRFGTAAIVEIVERPRRGRTYTPPMRRGAKSGLQEAEPSTSPANGTMPSS
jgi:hypothetical protein